VRDADQPRTGPGQNAPAHPEPHPTRAERREAFSQAVRDAKGMGDIATAFEKYAKK